MDHHHIGRRRRRGASDVGTLTSLMVVNGNPAISYYDNTNGNLKWATYDASQPDIAVAQAGPVADGGSVDFGTVTVGSSSAAVTFTITNPGTADLTSLVVTKDGTDNADFTVSALSATSIPVGAGTVTFSVTLSPGSSGAKTAAIHIAGNVTGAKNPYDITLTGTGQTIYQAWAAGHGVAADSTNLPNFAFGMLPNTSGALVYVGTLAGNGTITSTGTPVTMSEPSGNGVDFHALFVRRKDYVAAGLTYTPQFSADLTTWQDSATVPFPSFIAGKQARFFRVSLSIGP